MSPPQLCIHCESYRSRSPFRFELLRLTADGNAHSGLTRAYTANCTHPAPSPSHQHSAGNRIPINLQQKSQSADSCLCPEPPAGQSRLNRCRRFRATNNTVEIRQCFDNPRKDNRSSMQRTNRIKKSSGISDPLRCGMKSQAGGGYGWDRTTDLTIMSRALSPAELRSPGRAEKNTEAANPLQAALTAGA